MMKRKFTLFTILATLPFIGWNQAVITAVFDGPLSGGIPKGVEIFVQEDIANLSLLGVSSANNGGGSTGGPELSFSGSASANTYIYVATETPMFEAFFGFPPDFTDQFATAVNGNDAIELYYDGQVIDVFGDVDTDGTGTAWEYTNGWAYRESDTGPDGSTFVLDNWYFSGVDGLTGATDNSTAANPVPLETYATAVADAIVIVSGTSFDPSALVIDVGRTVEWQNTGGTHNVNGGTDVYPQNPDSFYSFDPMPAPWDWSFTFEQSGIYRYQCDVHEGVGMTGLIAVRPAADHYIDVQNNEFVPADITISLGETVVWTNISGIHNVNGSTAAYPDNPEGFSSGAASQDWIYSFTFDQPGTYDYHCDPHLAEGMTGTIVVGDQYQNISLAEVDEVDADGFAVYQDELVEVQGLVYGQNLRPDGLQFALIDGNNDGIAVFSFNQNLGYTVEEGDELVVRGMVDQFNGLIEIIPDDIDLISQGNTLLDPEVVQALGEETESSFIKLEDLTLVDPTQWPAAGAEANVQALKGSDTVVIRIEEQIDAGPAPSGAFHVSGIGGQFDPEPPYLDGYQVFPRGAADIEEVSPTDDLFVSGQINMFPNPLRSELRIESELKIYSLFITDNSGRLVYSTREIQGGWIRLDLSSLPDGWYAIHLETEEGPAASELIKQSD